MPTRTILGLKTGCADVLVRRYLHLMMPTHPNIMRESAHPMIDRQGRRSHSLCFQIWFYSWSHRQPRRLAGETSDRQSGLARTFPTGFYAGPGPGAAAGGAASGIIRLKAAPSPAALTNSIFAPSMAASSLLIAKPRPVPLCWRVTEASS